MNKPEIVALYLPQYYETDYNSEWWGKGYTEWTACKQARPLFKGHYQPRIPQEARYYNLSEKAAIMSQVELAKKYGIDGFVIYQYYSVNDNKYGDKNGKHGRMLLNKPTEIIRDHKDIDFPFCLYWANHDWRKMWFGQDPQMLWPQQYGDEQDWEEFFQYNLPYFQDKRYITIDNKPVYFIFASWHFKKIEQFIECWNRLAKQNGFDGVFFIKTEDAHNDNTIEPFNAVYRREPFYTFAKGFTKMDFIRRLVRTRGSKLANKLLNKMDKGVIGYTCSYDKAWNSIINRDDYTQVILPGAFADWDNTARKQYNAQILTGASPEKFGMYLKQLYIKCSNHNVPYIIINAWNEWAEGAYLEPDQKYGCSYLNEILKIKNNMQ